VEKGKMAERIPNPSEPLVKIDRRVLLGSAVGIGSASIVPSIGPSQLVLIDSVNALLKTSAPILNVSAATTRSLQEIQARKFNSERI
jgi:hypothetical protein